MSNINAAAELTVCEVVALDVRKTATPEERKALQVQGAKEVRDAIDHVKVGRSVARTLYRAEAFANIFGTPLTDDVKAKIKALDAL